MRRRTRNLALLAAIPVALAVAFLIPTLWGRPWSIEHFYARVFLEFALDRPMLLSQLRILEPYGLDFHSDDLDDFSVAFARESQRKVQESLRVLRGYDRSAQSPSQQLSTEILEWFLETLSGGEPFLFHDYPVNQLNGIQNTLPDFMLNIHQIHDRDDAENYVRRLGGFGVAFDQVTDGLRYREQRGVLPPRFVIEHVRREVEEFTAQPAQEHVLFTSFAARIDRSGAIGSDDRERLLAAARREIEETVYPGYARLGEHLVHMQAVATEQDGVWKLPRGEAYYAWALRFHTTSELSAGEIHALGLAEVERIRAEMREILESEGLPAEDLAATLQALNADGRFLYPDTQQGREQVLADYRAIIEDAQARLPALFGTLPGAPVTVERVPEFKQAGAPGAYYNPPPFDGSKPGIFYANLRSVREIPKFGMRTLTYHEAIPGHHLQIAIAQELEGVPFFRRVVPFTAYVEGWALYAERLAAEQGFHPTPYDRLGQLVAEAFRAVRLVVDTGIHALRWTRARAIDYMLENTGMPRTDVVAEVERYIVMPGQACAYKVGQLRST